MNFSIIIPTCNRTDLLRLCLDRFAPGCQHRATLRGDGAPSEQEPTYEVIVTDDGASEQTQALIAELYPWVKWTPGPRRGPASNRNHGASLATAEWVIFVDDDCVPDLGIVSAYGCARLANPGAQVIEGRTYVDRPRRSLAECAPQNESGGFLWSCNFAIQRELFRALGGFDERFPYACMEDVDFRERLVARVGKFVFCKDAAVCHPWRPRRIPREFSQYEETLPLFFSAHPAKRNDLSASYFFRVAFRLMIQETIPSLWRYSGSGFFVGVRHQMFCLKMGLKVFFNRIPKYESDSKR